MSLSCHSAAIDCCLRPALPSSASQLLSDAGCVANDAKCLLFSLVSVSSLLSLAVLLWHIKVSYLISVSCSNAVSLPC